MQYSIALSERQSRHILDQVIHANAQITIDPIGKPQRSLVGFLASGDDDVLVVELTGGAQPGLNDLVGRCVGVQVFSDDRYLFNSTCVRGPSWHDADQIALKTPRVLQVMQRRQFWRAQLAPSSEVTLRIDRNGRPVQLTATLLNVSCEGLACKLAEAAAAPIDADAQIRVSFELPGTETPFEFDAVVRNRTPTSEGGCIVGMQFERTSENTQHETMLTRLSEFLYRPREVQTTVGATR